VSHSKFYFARDSGLLNVGESILIYGTDLKKLISSLFDLLLRLAVED